MKQKDFEDLKQSVIEMGEVRRGERQPSREIAHEIQTPRLRPNPQSTWAICITDEDDALIPLKVYEIKLSKTDYVAVVDEEGEKLVCPASWFLPLDLQPEADRILAELVA